MTPTFHQFMLDLNCPGHLISILFPWPSFKPVHLTCCQKVGGKFRRPSTWGWVSCLELLGEEPCKGTAMIQQDIGNSQGICRLTFGNSRKRPKGPRGYEGISCKGGTSELTALQMSAPVGLLQQTAALEGHLLEMFTAHLQDTPEVRTRTWIPVPTCPPKFHMTQIVFSSLQVSAVSPIKWR